MLVVEVSAVVVIDGEVVVAVKKNTQYFCNYFI